MANPYFNATYYLANNPDVFAAGINTAEGAWQHYVEHGAKEALNGVASRSPAPWFDIEYYLKSNPDLTVAGLDAGQLFDHFVNYGIEEKRQPSAGANVNAETLAAYAAANADLREAFGIEEGEELTDAQLLQLAQHYYANGYNEKREGKPAEYEPEDPNTGETFTLTAGVDTFQGTAANDTFNAALGTLQTTDTLVGAGGEDVLNATLSTAAQTPVLDGIETLNLTTIAAGGTLSLASASGYKTVSVTGAGNLALNAFDQTAGAVVKLNNYNKTATVQANDLTGTADVMSLSLNGTGSKAVANLDAAVAGVLETLNVESAGNAKNAISLTATGSVAGLTKTVVTGAAALDMTVAHTIITGQTLDASGHAGDLNLIVDRNGATTATTNLTNATGVNTYTFIDSTAGTDAVVASGLVDGANVVLANDFAAGSSLVVRGAATSTANTINVRLDNVKDATNVAILGLKIADIETVNLVSEGGTTAGNSIGGLDVKSGSTVTVDGSTKLDLQLAATSTVSTIEVKGSGAHKVDFAGPAVYAEGKNLSIDGSTATGKLTLDGSDFTGTAGGVAETLTIMGGSADDTITGTSNAAAKNVIDAGAGNDKVSVSTANASTITLGEGSDELSITGVTGAGSVTITDFALGTGGDKLSVDTAGVMTFGGTAATGAADKLIIANVSVADDTAAKALVNGAAAGEYAVIVLNDSTGVAELWYDANGTAGGEVKLATFDNITTVGMLTDTTTGFIEANFGTWA